MCIPFDEDFTFQIRGAKITDQAEGAIPLDTIPSEEVDSNETSAESDVVETPGSSAGEATTGTESTTKEKDRSLLGFFLLALALGIAGIFTPCVFPMIPMNIAFFLNYKGGRSKGKFLAIFYGLSIIFIYSILGLLITVIFGAQAMNAIVSHWLTNVIFFLIFIFFAASFFGAYELVLPSKWVNKADSQVDKGGLIGTFFMALTLVLVSFSCTAAFIGTILVEAADGTSLLKPFVGMLGFSIGFGVPFALLALFPSVMQKMPKSGGWMNAVKVVFGFIILAFGMKFLIIPDQTYHLGLLSRDLYIAIWIVLFSLMGLYLLGKYKFHHDTEVQHIGFFRLLLVIVTFSFVVYLIPGLFGADLKGISGLLPPKSSQKFSITGTMAAAPASESTLCETPLYSDFLHTPKGTEGYFDLDEAIACAKAQNKPLFIDFTGHGCANCKVMENTVWADPRVVEKFRKDFIIVALYNDDNTQLPEDKWVTTDNGKVLKTMGRINKHFQEAQFGSVAVPYYVVVDHELNMLSGPWTTDKSIEGFLKFLDDGVKKFQANNN
jgi:thiol:disulfide interchange protein DsbD